MIITNIAIASKHNTATTTNNNNNNKRNSNHTKLAITDNRNQYQLTAQTALPFVSMMMHAMLATMTTPSAC